MDHVLASLERVFSRAQIIYVFGTLYWLCKRTISLIEFFHATLRAKSIPPERQYQYQSLPSPRHIRLLRLLGRNAVLPVEVKAFSIDDAPEYDALSYTWGDTRMQFGLSCGSKLIAVPSDNLSCCLKTLANRRFSRWIWVDAICINQQDEREKYHQIPLMREIYSKASEILRPGPRGKYGDQYSAPIPFKMIRETLTSIFHRPYFTRIWIQQEIVLGKNLFILCGESKVPWEAFTELSETCMYQGQLYVSDIVGLKSLRDNWHSETPNHRMMVNAVNFFARHKQATDAKDRVLGVLGLCPPEISESLVLGADLSVTETYTNFARWNLGLGRFQEILITLDYAHHFSGLPSWCPNLM